MAPHNQHRTERVRTTAEKHADHVESLLDQARGKFSDLADDAREQGGELLDNVKDRGEEWVEDAQDKGQDAWKAVLAWVRKNPGAALGYSFLAGLVIRSFLSRSED